MCLWPLADYHQRFVCEDSSLSFRFVTFVSKTETGSLKYRIMEILLTVWQWWGRAHVVSLPSIKNKS